MRHLVNFNNPVSLDNFGPHPKTDAEKSRWSYDFGMNTSRFCPKRQNSPLQRARLSLGLPVVDARPKNESRSVLAQSGVGRDGDLLPWSFER